MAAEEAYPGLPYLVDPTANDLFEDGYIEFLRGKADKVKCRLRSCPHCINIAQGVRGRYLAEPIRIVHNGRKYAIETIEEFEFDSARVVVAKRISPVSMRMIESWDVLP